METTNISGVECYVLENDQIRLLVTHSVGPRILRFGFQDGENLFAELPEIAINFPGLSPFHFYGGHRFWHAPELPRRTYLSDDAPVEITPFDHGVSAAQSVEAQTGLQKTMEIQLLGDSAQVAITHRLTNHALWSVTCAPWAITQLKTGGVAILPQIREDTGVLPNRSLTLWPYTDMTNPSVQWGSNYILLQVNLTSPFKIGFPNPRGWLAYWWNGILFVKHAEYNPHANYYDFGSSSECYCNDLFLELETLAPISEIAPGDTVSHTEIWNLYRDVDRPNNEEDVQRLVEKIGLE